MKFRATNDQMRSIMAAAVNASIPVGLGIINYQNRPYGPDDFTVNDDTRTVSLDYVHGRMVKFRAFRVKGSRNQWEADDKIDQEYQSWAKEYASYAALVFMAIGTDAVLEGAE